MRPRGRPPTAACARYFNPRTPCGVRPLLAEHLTGAGQFQSTHPVRGATGGRLKRSLILDISIHAPRAGCDQQLAAVRQLQRISIHAPRAGCDVFASVWRKKMHKFQSTHPVRGATAAVRRLKLARDISIHAPRAGCDAPAGKRKLDGVISIHAPRAGCDRHAGGQGRRAVISIHAPRAGCDDIHPTK